MEIYNNCFYQIMFSQEKFQIYFKSNIYLKYIIFNFKYINFKIFTGGRDNQGGAILTFPAKINAHEKFKSEEINSLILYLSSVPRFNYFHDFSFRF